MNSLENVYFIGLLSKQDSFNVDTIAVRPSVSESQLVNFTHSLHIKDKKNEFDISSILKDIKYGTLDMRVRLSFGGLIFNSDEIIIISGYG